MRWAERETGEGRHVHTSGSQRALHPLVGDQPTLVNKQSLWSFRLTCEGSEWGMSGKSRFLINVSLNVRTGNSHTWAILKTVYLIIHLQNLGDFGPIVCHSVCPLANVPGNCLLNLQGIRGQKAGRLVLWTYFLLHHRLLGLVKNILSV